MDLEFSDIPGEEDVRQRAEAHLVGKARKDPAFRRELIRDPKGVVSREFGVNLPQGFDVKVLQETSGSLYLVLPAAAEEHELSDQLLEAVAGGCGKGTTTKSDAGTISSPNKETAGIEE